MQHPPYVNAVSSINLILKMKKTKFIHENC